MTTPEPEQDNEATMAYAAVIAVCGVAYVLINRVSGALADRRRARHEALHGPEPICGCGDHYSFHDPETGYCHADHLRPCKWDPESAEATDYERQACTCRQYVGPQPLAAYYAPPLTGQAPVRGRLKTPADTE